MRPTCVFTEAEVRNAFIIGIAMGKSIDEITAKIIDVTANTQRDKDGKIIDRTSRLAKKIDTLREAGYIR